jgi:hypothetical protein
MHLWLMLLYNNDFLFACLVPLCLGFLIPFEQKKKPQPPHVALHVRSQETRKKKPFVILKIYLFLLLPLSPSVALDGCVIVE